MDKTYKIEVQCRDFHDRYSCYLDGNDYMYSNSSPEEKQAHQNYMNGRRRFSNRPMNDDESIILNAIDRGTQAALFHLFYEDIKRMVIEEINAAIIKSGGEIIIKSPL